MSRHFRYNQSMPLRLPKALWIAIAIYIAVLGTVTVLRHYHFQTQAWDMGIFDQLFWNSLHGKLMQSSLEEIPHHFGIHWSPFLLLLIPLYALWQSPYALLLIQTIALAAGAIPLYFLARKILSDTRWPLLIAGAYLLYSPLHWINFFDFHEIAFFIPLALAALYCIEIESWRWAIVFSLLAATTKEDAVIAVIFLGLYAVIRKFPVGKNPHRAKIIGTGIALAGIIYFLFAIKIWMPAFGGGLLRLDRYSNLGGSAAEIVRNIFTHPQLIITTVLSWQKISYLAILLLPLALLPFAGGWTLILLIPGLAENLLTNFSSQFSGMYQYDAVLIPGIFISLLFGIQYSLKKWPNYQNYIKNTLIACVILGFLFKSPVSPFNGIFTSFSSEDTAQLREVIKTIPTTASVTAHTNIVPHLSQREHIYMLGQEPDPTDYVILDATDSFGFKDEDAFNAYFERYQSLNYQTKLVDKRYVILHR